MTKWKYFRCVLPSKTFTAPFPKRWQTCLLQKTIAFAFLLSYISSMQYSFLFLDTNDMGRANLTRWCTTGVKIFHQGKVETLRLSKMEKMRENCHQTYFDENSIYTENILICKRIFFGEPAGWDKIPTLWWTTALSLGHMLEYNHNFCQFLIFKSICSRIWKQ